MFTLTSTDTLMGHRAHTVTTTGRDFAFAIFEQALEVDIEPDFSQKKGTFTIEFICNDAEAFAAIQTAQNAILSGVA